MPTEWAVPRTRSVSKTAFDLAARTRLWSLNKQGVLEAVIYINSRITEAYLGEYASGKSEIAVERALGLARKGRPVTLVDLDLVEPCYTLRPLIPFLADNGVTALSSSTASTPFLGEAGQPLMAAARWALRREGDIIFDVGYGAHGAGILRLLEDAGGLKRILVANHSRPMTHSAEQLIAYAKTIDGLDSIIANTHMGEETTDLMVNYYAGVTAAAGERLGLPLTAVAISEGFLKKYPGFCLEYQGQNPAAELMVLRLVMADAFW